MTSPIHDPSGALFTTPRLSVRALGVDDDAELQRVFMAAGDYFLSITGHDQPDPGAAERELQSAAVTPGRSVALVYRREDGEPVGALGWWEGNPEPDVTLLGMLLMVPAERGKGLGREALSGLTAVLAERGMRHLRTAVGAGDTERHRLLRALGFRDMDQRTHVSLDRGRIMIALFEMELGEAETAGSGE